MKSNILAGLKTFVEGNERDIASMLDADLKSSCSDLVNSLADVMRVNALQPEGLLARFFDDGMLSRYLTVVLQKSGKGNTATLASRIDREWQRPTFGNDLKLRDTTEPEPKVRNTPEQPEKGGNTAPAAAKGGARKEALPAGDEVAAQTLLAVVLSDLEAMAAAGQIDDKRERINQIKSSLEVVGSFICQNCSAGGDAGDAGAGGTGGGGTGGGGISRESLFSFAARRYSWGDGETTGESLEATYRKIMQKAGKAVPTPDKAVSQKRGGGSSTAADDKPGDEAPAKRIRIAEGGD